MFKSTVNYQEKFLIGSRKGMLTVVSFPRSIQRINTKGEKRNDKMVLCKCDCGKEKVMSFPNFIREKTESCGCLAIIRVSLLRKTHGKSRSNKKEFQTWCRMKGRCSNKKSKDYKDYGRRGIIVCERWINSFEYFLEDMGCKPIGKYSIERLDVNGNYEPTNCIWGTDKIQARNRTNTRRVLYKGVERLVIDLCEEFNIGYFTLLGRVKLGWDIELALTTPKK